MYLNKILPTLEVNVQHDNYPFISKTFNFNEINEVHFFLEKRPFYPKIIFRIHQNHIRQHFEVISVTASS